MFEVLVKVVKVVNVSKFRAAQLIEKVRAMAVSVFLCSLLVTSCGDEPQPPPSQSKPKESNKSNDYDGLIMRPVSASSLRRSINVYMPGHKSSRNWQDYFTGAGTALKDRDYDAAEYLLDEAIKLDPNQGVLYDLRGRARANSTRTNNEMALEDMKKAHKLNSLSENGFIYLARLYDGSGKTDKALESLNEGIEKYPKVKDLYKSRAAMYTEKKEYAKAKQDYDRTIALDPEDSLPYLLRAQTNETLGRNEDALKDYTLAAKNRSRDRLEKKTVAHKSRALLLAKMGRHKEAIAEVEKLTGSDNDEEMMRFRGDRYIALKMYDKAIAEYTKSIDLAPDLARQSYEARAKAYEAIGKLDLAQADRDSAKKLDEIPAEETLYKFKQ